MGEIFEGVSKEIVRLITEFSDSKFGWLNIGTPWITEGAKSWLSRNIGPQDRVLEFGAGRSTIFWSKHAGRVTVVEGSPDWTIWVLLYLYQNPSLLKKIRWYFCPAEWNPSFDRGVRRYWTENKASLDSNDIYDLERDLCSVNFSGNNIILFDGNIRKNVFLCQIAQVDFDEVDVIVIDNCEGAFTSESADVLIPKTFSRLDFVAGLKDDIPSHQKGKHITSIFVKKERLSKSVNVMSYVRENLTREDRKKYQLPSDGMDLEKEINEGYKYLNDCLGVRVSRRKFS